MSSSHRRGAASKASATVEPEISAAARSDTRHGASGGSEATSTEVGNLAPASAEPDRSTAGSVDASKSATGVPEQGDPWFGAAGQSAVETGSVAAAYGNGSSDDPAWQRASEPAEQVPFDPEATLVDWFLPGGRAALLPESMTVSSDEEESGQRQQVAPAVAASVPPWSADTTGSAGGEPPPWENGPWSGPGGAWPTRPPAPSIRARQPVAGQDEPTGPWTPRNVLVTGLLPLVVPGLVVGLIGLRRSSSGEPGRLASMLALAASLGWAVVIVVLVMAGTGGSSAGCSYPAAVHQAYATAMADLGGTAPAAKRATDFGLAATRANSAAAAAGKIQLRTALLAMAQDLQSARADVIANRPVPGSLRARLTADGAALTASCPA